MSDRNEVATQKSRVSFDIKSFEPQKIFMLKKEHLRRRRCETKYPKDKDSNAVQS
jgi:hypothetical protein